VRVDHPGDDEEAGAVDPLGVVRRALDDPAAGDGDVGAAELAPVDVDEAVREDEVGYVPATVTVVTSAIAAVPISSSRTWRGKPSASRTGPTARATATSAT
jgi:hypothetical protein